MVDIGRKLMSRRAVATLLFCAVAAILFGTGLALAGPPTDPPVSPVILQGSQGCADCHQQEVAA